MSKLCRRGDHGSLFLVTLFCLSFSAHCVFGSTTTAAASAASATPQFEDPPHEHTSVMGFVRLHGRSGVRWCPLPEEYPAAIIDHNLANASFDCQKHAENLKFPYVDMSTAQQIPADVPRAKDCFVYNSTVYYNPNGDENVLCSTSGVSCFCPSFLSITKDITLNTCPSATEGLIGTYSITKDRCNEKYVRSLLHTIHRTAGNVYSARLLKGVRVQKKDVNARRECWLEKISFTPTGSTWALHFDDRLPDRSKCTTATCNNSELLCLTPHIPTLQERKRVAFIATPLKPDGSVLRELPADGKWCRVNIDTPVHPTLSTNGVVYGHSIVHSEYCNTKMAERLNLTDVIVGRFDETSRPPASSQRHGRFVYKDKLYATQQAFCRRGARQPQSQSQRTLPAMSMECKYEQTEGTRCEPAPPFIFHPFPNVSEATCKELSGAYPMLSFNDLKKLELRQHVHRAYTFEKRNAVTVAGVTAPMRCWIDHDNLKVVWSNDNPTCTDAKPCVCASKYVEQATPIRHVTSGFCKRVITHSLLGPDGGLGSLVAADEILDVTKPPGNFYDTETKKYFFNAAVYVSVPTPCSPKYPCACLYWNETNSKHIYNLIKPEKTLHGMIPSMFGHVLSHANCSTLQHYSANKACVANNQTSANCTAASTAGSTAGSTAASADITSVPCSTMKSEYNRRGCCLNRVV